MGYMEISRGSNGQQTRDSTAAAMGILTKAWFSLGALPFEIDLLGSKCGDSLEHSLNLWGPLAAHHLHNKGVWD